MPDISKKIRIQLYDPQMNQTEDRLVEQSTELMKGPKTKHIGPMKVEVCLFDQSDVSGFIDYLNKLVGNLPIESKVNKPKKALADPDDFRANILKAWQDENQETLIRFLRENGFIFVTTQYLSDMGLTYCTEKEFQEYAWMVRQLKRAKDPKNDKFDPHLQVGFYLGKEKTDQVVVYLDGQIEEVQTIPWKKEDSYTFKKARLVKFPVYMTQDERDRWRKEHRLLIDDPEKVASKFFLRWYKDVTFREKEDFEKRFRPSTSV